MICPFAISLHRSTLSYSRIVLLGLGITGSKFYLPVSSIWPRRMLKVRQAMFDLNFYRSKLALNGQSWLKWFNLSLEVLVPFA